MARNVTSPAATGKPKTANIVLRNVMNRIELDIDDQRYMCLPTEQKEFETSANGGPFMFTIFAVTFQELKSKQQFMNEIQVIFEGCGAFSHVFARACMLYTDCKPNGQTSNDLDLQLHRLGATWTKIFEGTPIECAPIAGPYLQLGTQVFKAFRIYDDVRGAFMTALDPGNVHKAFIPLNVIGNYYQTLRVLIPPRLPKSGFTKRPLEGLNMVVKDCWRMKGLRNTMENRAYHEVDTKSDKTAHVVSQLMDCGAIPLGLTKLSCFAAREEPIESVDYQLPFNPHGDGYQSPAGSSNGSAVAVAAYDWVDFGIGTDSMFVQLPRPFLAIVATGSGRRPTLFNGCFSLRPFQTSVSTQGIIPTFERFDTISLFTRDLELLFKIADCIIQSPQAVRPERSMPLRLLYPSDYLPVKVPEQMAVIRAFIKDLEKATGIVYEECSIRQTWNRAPPAAAKGMEIDEFLKDVATNTFLNGFYHNFADFRARYRQKNCKEPFVTAFTKWRCIDPAEHAEALRRIDIYGDWFLNTILKQDSHDTIMILPIADVVPHYRDDPLGPFFKQDAFDALFIAPILRAPEVVVPIGQIPYTSRISGCTEQFPVAVSLLGLPGTDLKLLQTVQDCLMTSGRPSTVLMGKIMFSI